MKKLWKQRFLRFTFLIVLLFLGCIYINWYVSDDSDYGAISLWYPQWACGDVPDMLVIGSDDKQLENYIGKYVYLCITGQFWYKKYSGDSRYGNYKYKLYCTGRFKRNIRMKLHEMNSIFDFFDTQGLFFDADNCIPVKTTDLEKMLIDSLLEQEEQ